MSEQQIVITFTPEQYAKVQHLSRASGGKHVAAFVKHRLLSALGIIDAGEDPSPGSEGTGTQSSSAQKIRLLEEQLEHIHQELNELKRAAETFDESPRVAPSSAVAPVRPPEQDVFATLEPPSQSKPSPSASPGGMRQGGDPLEQILKMARKPEPITNVIDLEDEELVVVDISTEAKTVSYGELIGNPPIEIELGSEPKVKPTAPATETALPDWEVTGTGEFPVTGEAPGVPPDEGSSKEKERKDYPKKPPPPKRK